MNAYEIIVLAIVGLGLFWIFTHAPQIASDNPWKTGMYLVSLTAVVIFLGYFFFSGFDWTFTRLDADARQSKMLAAVARAFGLSPQDAGLSGQGTFLSREGGVGQIPGLVSAPAPESGQGVQIEIAPMPTDLGLIEIAPVTLQLAGDTLVLLLTDGTAQVKSAAEVVQAMACGVDTSDVRADGYPVFLVACPFSEGTRFLTAGVVLPPDFPKVADLVAETLPLLAPVETGGGEPIVMTPEEQGSCWLRYADSIDLLTVTQETGPLFLPMGTEWRLKGPRGFLDFGSWGSRNAERWTLTNQEMGVIEYPINGWVGRSFPGADDSKIIIVRGQGDVCVR